MTTKIPVILIVEDDAVLQSLYIEHCTRLGMSCIQIYDGSAAFDFVQHQLDEVDIVILDYMLPDMDGRVILEKIKTIQPTAPTLVISAIAEKTDDLALLQSGAILEIVKGDVPLHVIIETIAEFLKEDVQSLALAA